MLYWSWSSFLLLVFCSSSSSSSGCNSNNKLLLFMKWMNMFVKSVRSCDSNPSSWMKCTCSGWSEHNVQVTKFPCVRVIKPSSSASLNGGIVESLNGEISKSYPGVAVIPHQPMMWCLQHQSRSGLLLRKIVNATKCQTFHKMSQNCSTNKK